MPTTMKRIGAWEVKLSEKSNVLNIVVSNDDKSQVVDADNTSLGDEYEFAISMTSHQIEDDYKALEEAGRACEPVCENQDDNVKVGD